MGKITISRRDFLLASAGATAAALVNAPLWSATGMNPKEMLVSAFSDLDNQHFVSGVSLTGKEIWRAALPERAHAPVLHPTQAVIGIVARRPGFYIDFLNMNSGARVYRLEPQTDHHFYGHALFSRDGNFLITQENHYPTGAGKIVVREWPSLSVLNVFESGGIGPHESVFLSDDIIVVANGGLKTHPDNDREILNLDSMSPNLTYMNWKTGEILHQVRHSEELHQLSTRHLDISANGTVIVGCQHQGEAWENVPLIGISSINEPSMRYLKIPETVRLRFQQYCGSVCFDTSGRIVAISTPRGGFVAYWDTNTGKYLGLDNCRDVCGIAPSSEPGSFLLTSGTGKLLEAKPLQNSVELIAHNGSIRWDNHLRRVTM